MTTTKPTATKAEKLDEAKGRLWMVLFWVAAAVCGIAGVVLAVSVGSPMWVVAISLGGAVVNSWAAGMEMAVVGQLVSESKEAKGEN